MRRWPQPQIAGGAAPTKKSVCASSSMSVSRCSDAAQRWSYGSRLNVCCMCELISYASRPRNSAQPSRSTASASASRRSASSSPTITHVPTAIGCAARAAGAVSAGAAPRGGALCLQAGAWAWASWKALQAQGGSMRQGRAERPVQVPRRACCMWCGYSHACLHSTLCCGAEPGARLPNALCARTQWPAGRRGRAHPAPLGAPPLLLRKGLYVVVRQRGGAVPARRGRVTRCREPAASARSEKEGRKPRAHPARSSISLSPPRT